MPHGVLAITPGPSLLSRCAGDVPPVPCSCLFPRGATIRSRDCGLDAAPDIESALDDQRTRRQSGDQIVQNKVGDGFVKMALVAKRPQVQFEALELHTKFVRKINNSQGREIWLAGQWADTSEFVGFKLDLVVAF